MSCNFFINEEDINDMVCELLYDSKLIDEYADKCKWLDKTPDDLFNFLFIDELSEVNNKEKFKEEMQTRIDCVWGDKIKERLKELFYKYNRM